MTKIISKIKIPIIIKPPTLLPRVSDVKTPLKHVKTNKLLLLSKSATSPKAFLIKAFSDINLLFITSLILHWHMLSKVVKLTPWQTHPISHKVKFG